MNNFIKKFNWIFIIYFFLIVIFPGGGNSSISNFVITFILTILYFTTVNLSLIVHPVKYLDASNVFFLSNRNNILYFSLLAFMGLIFYMYDRIFLLGIDYSQGIASARFQLTDATENAKGINSVYSLMGNIFMPFSFWNFIFLYKGKDLKKSFRSFFLTLNILIIVISSLLFGGRTNILMLIIIILIIREKPSNDKKMSFLQKAGLLLGLIFLFFIIGYVFYDRANANNFALFNYLDNMVVDLRGSLNKEFYNFLANTNAFLSNTLSLLLMIVGYFIHSFWVFSSIIDTTNTGVAVGFGYAVILNKFGLIGPPNESSVGGLFLSLPAGVFYTFGYLGYPFFLFSVFFAMKLVNVFNRMKGLFYSIGFVIFICMIMVFAASSFVILFDVLMFPGFILSGIVWSVFMRKNVNRIS